MDKDELRLEALSYAHNWGLTHSSYVISDVLSIAEKFYQFLIGAKEEDAPPK